LNETYEVQQQPPKVFLETSLIMRNFLHGLLISLHDARGELNPVNGVPILTISSVLLCLPISISLFMV